MNTAKLWQPNNYTKVPNDILGHVVSNPKSLVEDRITILVARLSFGFHRRSTIRRLSVTDIASLVHCDVSTASRAIGCLLKSGRIFRSDQQGDHYFYTLRDPDATGANPYTTSHDLHTKVQAVNANSPITRFVPKQTRRGGTAHISSVLKGMEVKD